MQAESFEDLCAVVAEASSPDEVFGALRGNRPGWRAELRADFDRMSALADPGRFADEGSRQAAEIVRRRLEELYAEALGEGGRQPDAHGYREAAPDDGEARMTVTTRKGTYEAGRVLARGDVAALYEGRCRSGPHAGREVVLKIAADPADNDLLLDEIGALEHLFAAGGPQRKHLPELLDQFQTPQGSAGSVLGRVEGFDLLAVRERLPLGVPPEHVIWILNRLLSTVGYAHQAGVIHGNIEPTHVMVRPRDHNVVLVDWCYSIINPARTGRGFKCENPDYSAPEVGQRKPPLPASDLYSVGKCAIYMLGGDIKTNGLPADVDPRLARFILYLVRPSPLQRAQNAWEMFEEMCKVRRAVFGPHKFIEFKL